MISADRQKLILEYLRQKETVLSSALAKEFGVTLMTIGRDLKQLEEKGLLVRTHGGAMLPGFMEAETSYAKKKSSAIEVKRRLAAAALPFLHPGMTLFLDAGTTTYEIAEQLVSEKINDLTVITNYLRIALLLYPSKELRTIMLGGRILRETGGVAGALAAEELASYVIDLAILGTSAVTDDLYLVVPTEAKMMFKRQAMEKSGAAILVADHTKFHKKKCYKVAPLQAFTHIITDVKEDALVQAGLEEKLIIA